MNNLIELSTLLYTNQRALLLSVLHCLYTIFSCLLRETNKKKSAGHNTSCFVVFFPVMEKALLMHFLIYINTNNKHCI